MPVSLLDVADSVVRVEDCVMMVDGSHCEVRVSVPVGSIVCGADEMLDALVTEGASLGSVVSDGSILLVCDAGSTRDVDRTELPSLRLALVPVVTDAAAVEETGRSDDAASVKAEVLDDAVLLACDRMPWLVADPDELASSTSVLDLAVATVFEAVSEAEPKEDDASGLVCDAGRSFVADKLAESLSVVALSDSSELGRVADAGREGVAEVAVSLPDIDSLVGAAEDLVRGTAKMSDVVFELELPPEVTAEAEAEVSEDTMDSPWETRLETLADVDAVLVIAKVVRSDVSLGSFDEGTDKLGDAVEGDEGEIDSLSAEETDATALDRT